MDKGDDVKYQEIRQAFAECSVCIGHDGIFIIFHSDKPEKRITVALNSEEDKGKLVFDELLSDADSAEIKLAPDRVSQFIFHMGIPIDTTLVFQPASTGRTQEEVDEEVKEIISTSAFTDEWNSSFQDCNLTDESQVLQALARFFDRTRKSQVYNLRGVQQWQELSKSARVFAKQWRFGEVSFEEPDEALDFGIIDFVAETDKDLRITINGEMYREFQRMIGVAGSVTLDSFQEDGKSIFILSVYSI